MKIVLILTLSISSHAYAINCEWWQTKYSSTIVDKHPREQTTVREHPRKEYCRNKWKDADLHIEQFQNYPISGWPHKGEIFKNWGREDTQAVLEILPLLPEWTEIKKFSFRRAIKSNNEGNPATSEITHKAIILFDLFFTENDKATILTHESAHHLYFNKLSSEEIREFLALSGWTIEISKDRKVYEIPPRKLIKPDSATDKDEDFANHLELYFKAPKNYKHSHPKLFDFFHKRYPL